MLAEAACACFYAGNPAEMLASRGADPRAAAGRAVGTGPLPGRDGNRDGADHSAATRRAGAESVHEAVTLAEGVGRAAR